VAAFAGSVGPRLRALVPAARQSETFLRAVAAWSGTRDTGSGVRLNGASA
jgi:hypothetical protein